MAIFLTSLRPTGETLEKAPKVGVLATQSLCSWLPNWETRFVQIQTISSCRLRKSSYFVVEASPGGILLERTALRTNDPPSLGTRFQSNLQLLTLSNQPAAQVNNQLLGVFRKETLSHLSSRILNRSKASCLSTHQRSHSTQGKWELLWLSEDRGLQEILKHSLKRKGVKIYLVRHTEASL